MPLAKLCLEKKCHSKTAMDSIRKLMSYLNKKHINLFKQTPKLKSRLEKEHSRGLTLTLMYNNRTLISMFIIVTSLCNKQYKLKMCSNSF